MRRPPARLLLGPGPSCVEPRVLAAMAQAPLGHLDSAFLDILDDCSSMLREVFRTDNPLTLAISGTGTAAMEAAVANLIEPGDRAAVCIAGYFGARIAEMIRRHGGAPVAIEAPWGRPVGAEDVERALRAADGPLKLIAVVHAETSTGVLQPIDDIARIARERGALVIVDAVTSLGGVPIAVDEAGIDVCWSATQKCLGAPPGLSPLTVSPRARDAIRRRRSPCTSFHLDLNLLEAYWFGDRAYHHTAPSNAFYALAEALTLIREEGLEARWDRHHQVHERLALGAQGLGLEFLVAADHRLPVLSTLLIPGGMDDRSVRRRLIEEHGIEIGGGLGPLAGRVWRVGLMGGSAREEHVARLLTALRIILGAPRMSRPVRP